MGGLSTPISRLSSLVAKLNWQEVAIGHFSAVLPYGTVEKATKHELIEEKLVGNNQRVASHDNFVEHCYLEPFSAAIA